MAGEMSIPADARARINMLLRAQAKAAEAVGHQVKTASCDSADRAQPGSQQDLADQQRLGSH